MSPQFAECLKRLAVELDWLKQVQPPGYEANIVLVNLADAEGHIFIGQSDPSKISATMAELIANPGHIGRASAERVVDLPLCAV